MQDDLRSWYPELANNVRISLVEALPSVLPMFSKRLIEYTETTFKEAKIDILTKTMVKEIKEKAVVLQMPDKSIVEVPCGLVIWAAVRATHTPRVPHTHSDRTGQQRAPDNAGADGEAA